MFEKDLAEQALIYKIDAISSNDRHEGEKKKIYIYIPQRSTFITAREGNRKKKKQRKIAWSTPQNR